AGYASTSGAPAIGLCAKLEMELAELPEQEAAPFLAALGIAERGLTRLVRACEGLLGLRTFFTIVSDEVRAWPVPAGTRAPAAAHGTIGPHIGTEYGSGRSDATESFLPCETPRRLRRAGAGPPRERRREERLPVAVQRKGACRVGTYEIVAVLRPDLDEAGLGAALERITQRITEHGGALKSQERWGK